MKKIKVSLAAIAIVIAVGLSAFTAPDTKLADGWFTITDASHPGVASSYTYSGASSPCSGTTALCAIQGTRNPANLNQPLQSSVDADKTASNNFTQPAPGKVTFTP